MYLCQIEWDSSYLNDLVLTPEKTVADQVALTVGALGENIAVRRAAYMQALDTHHFSHYVHVAGSAQ